MSVISLRLHGGNCGRRRLCSSALVLCSVLLILPIVGVFTSVFSSASEGWQHIRQTVLVSYLRDTVVLSSGVMVVSMVLGTMSAWITSRYDFRFKHVVEIILAAPLAIPTYINAYAYAGLFSFGGPVHRFLTGLGFAPERVARVQITSMGGLILVMGFTLYPYVYLILKEAFSRSMSRPLYVSMSLGVHPLRQFFALELTMARPALVAAGVIVLMETLNEYGAVLYYGQNTLSTGVFRAWFGLYDLTAARRLGVLLVLAVLVILFIERRQRGNRLYADRVPFHFTPRRLSPGRSALCLGLSTIAPLLGLILPVSQLAVWAFRHMDKTNWQATLAGLGNTVALGGVTSLILVLTALLMANGRRVNHGRPVCRFSDVALIGYAIPGAVIALGALGISRVFRVASGGLLLSGSIVLMIYAYLTRFIGVSQRPISMVLEERQRFQDEAARSLGVGPVKTFLQIHLPATRTGVALAFLVSFLEIIKELPLTMILRPFNFNTLSLRVYDLAANEMVQDAAIPSIILIAIGILLTAFINALVKR